MLRETRKMSSVVCTLFEGHYHHGLAALANSLYHHGFRGEIWAGYRGQTPPWASRIVERDGTQCFEAINGLTVRFLKVETKRHLTNYKAEFMSDLRRNHLPDADTIFYCDPDIVLKTGWTFFPQWAEGGIALALYLGKLGGSQAFRDFRECPSCLDGLKLLCVSHENEPRSCVLACFHQCRHMSRSHHPRLVNHENRFFVKLKFPALKIQKCSVNCAALDACPFLKPRCCLS